MQKYLNDVRYLPESIGATLEAVKKGVCTFSLSPELSTLFDFFGLPLQFPKVYHCAQSILHTFCCFVIIAPCNLKWCFSTRLLPVLLVLLSGPQAVRNLVKKKTLF